MGTDGHSVRPCPNWVRTDILPGRCEPVSMLPQITACCHLALNLHVNTFVPIYDLPSSSLVYSSLITYYPPRPAEQSEAGQGAFYFSPHSDLYQVTTRELFKVTMYTLHISSNGSHFLTAWLLVYWTYKVSIFGYGRTKLMVTMYSKYTAHISWNGNHFLMAWFLVYWFYTVSKFGYGRTKLMVTMYFKYTANISSNGSHFLTAWFLVTEHIRSVNLGTVWKS